MGIFCSGPTRIPYVNEIVWLDPNPSEKEFQKLSVFLRVHKVQTVEQCIAYIKDTWIVTELPLICAGSLFENFSKELPKHPQEQQKIKHIYIFCWEPIRYQHLLNQKKIVCVENSTEKLIEKIRENLKHIQLPNFRSFADNQDKTKQLKYSYFLTYLTHTIEQNQRYKLIKECIDTLNKVQTQNQKQKFPIEDYPLVFDPIKVLYLYSQNIIYDFINKVLKLNYLTHIQKGHIIIHDINLAIKKYSTFQLRSKIPSILYRGSFITSSQIQMLNNNIGSSIQSLGFFSTSKNYDVSIKFMKNVLFKIYIPDFFKAEISKDLKIRDGYVQFASVFESRFVEYQVLFNIKSVFTVLRVQTTTTEDGKEVFIVQLLYGKVQMMLYLSDNKNKLQFDVYSQDPRVSEIKCDKCNSNLHLIGTCSKRRLCLKDFKHQILLEQSFILENFKNKVIGMPIEYDEDVRKSFRNTSIHPSAKICQICKSKVRCSECFDSFCLCSLENHDKEHLKQSYIMIEGELPQFLMFQLDENERSLFETHSYLESQIEYKADALRLMKDQHSFIEARALYSEEIQTSGFKKKDYTYQFNVHYNRAESYRLRKYLVKPTETLTIKGFQQCVQDYKKCFELVKDKPNQTLRQSKAMMGVAIVLDDIAVILEKEEKSRNQPLTASSLLYQDALENYLKAGQILAEVKKCRQWTYDETLQDLAIKNSANFIYWHVKDYETAVQNFEQIISLVEKLEIPVRREEAKYLNNMVQCIVQYTEYLNWSNLHLIKKHLKKAVKYGERSYKMRLCLFGAGYGLTNASKRNFDMACKYAKECEQKLQQKGLQ